MIQRKDQKDVRRFFFFFLGQKEKGWGENRQVGVKETGAEGKRLCSHRTKEQPLLKSVSSLAWERPSIPSFLGMKMAVLEVD